MQTPTLPQISAAAPRANANANANANASGDGAQFSQALSREIEQRKPSPSPAAAPAKPQAAAAKPQQAAPAQQAERPPAAAPAKPADGKRAVASGDAGATDEAKSDAADAAAVSPVADMLALVAAFNQPVAVAALPVTDPLAAAAAVAALKKAPEPIEYSTQPIKLDPAAVSESLDAATLPAALPAEDGKTMTFKEVAAAVDGAARMMDAPAPEPLKVDLAQPRGLVDADATPVVDKAPASVTMPAAVAAPVSPAEGDAAPVMAKAEPALAPTMVKVDAAAPRAREGAADITAIKEPAAVAPAPVSAPVQQASLVMAQGVHAANPGERIAARVGTPGWDNQVGQKIVWMVAGKEQSATLTLNPPDMGPMQVVLSVTNDQATVSFTAAQPEVRQALENAMPKLREMMSENGISLGNASVHEGAQDQRQAQQGEKSRGQGGGNRFGNGGGDAGAVETPRPTRSAGAGLVDTFA